ncbi:MAG TPA: hypothetical protein DDX98_11035 [Bacteroidales bacterium]|jgi:hypothetical protein|nr:hypothetical protein [Bacteroidales bacterium]
MKTFKSVLIIAGYTAFLIACSPNKPAAVKLILSTDTITASIIADTIIYDVIIKNTNPDDRWTEECLQYTHRDFLVKSIFKGLYARKLTAYHYITNTPLTIEEIKNLEKEEWFSKDAVGKIQFTEIWYYSAERNILRKEVLSMVLGVEQFTSVGELKGYKPLFRIYTN